MARIGIYAGTFDPIHRGHILFALVALRVGKLDKVVLIPELYPRHKQAVTDVNDRLAMISLATKEYPLLVAAELDDNQFSVAQTLPKLQERYGKDLVLVVGSDVAKTIDAWPGKERLVDEIELIVALRDGDGEAQISEILSGIGARFVCVPSPRKDISSSQLRKVQPDESHVHTDVLSYIAAKQLYALASGTK